MTSTTVKVDQRRQHILFVDDETRVLDGLKRMLRSMRKEWDMQFCTSGAEALDVLTTERIDVLVTDMRMPDMSGDELLELCAEQSPQTIRIVLSGHYDSEHVYKSISKAHQFLSKPCDKERLKQAISRACTLHDVLRDETLQTMIANMRTLPSPPALYLELSRAIEGDDISLARVGEIISADVAMTGKILQLVNSAWFAMRRAITDPTDAVLLLGTDTLKTLVLSAHVFSQLQSGESDRLNAICDHSVRVAQLARKIALDETSDRAVANCAFTAGMMHEVGLVVLMTNDGNRLHEAIAYAQKHEVDLASAERKVLHASHGEIGAYLLGLWGLPNPILEAVAFFDSPRKCPDDAFSPLSAVHAADAIIHDMEDSVFRAAPMDPLYLRRIGCMSRVESWREMALDLS